MYVSLWFKSVANVWEFVFITAVCVCVSTGFKVYLVTSLNYYFLISPSLFSNKIQKYIFHNGLGHF